MKYLISLAISHIPRKYLQLVGHLIAKALSIFYMGHRVQCPVCDHWYGKFLPYGRKARENALCPNCLALERHRLLWIYLKDKTSIFNHPQRMLHIAPEYCFINRLEGIDSLEYITADIESPLAKVRMDIHEIPFEDHSFESVMCNHVMEHVEDDRLAMKEILRVLKPGGWAIIQVPFFPPIPEETLEDPDINTPKQRLAKYGQKDHLRLYGKDYQVRLEECGFVVSEDNYVGTLPKETVDKFALPNEVIYLCNKI